LWLCVEKFIERVTCYLILWLGNAIESLKVQNCNTRYLMCGCVNYRVRS
jgi:hypothetical protein